MDNFDHAVARIKGEWPQTPYWIFTTPDQGKTLYRAMRSDVCPDCFKDSYGQPIKQLYSVDGEIVGLDKDYGKQETHYGKA
jgi:hypothetical protein|tara:strand:- start:349 stop:591 length:243 start_codon:yes stop_codon:yes gene_type:complete